jgi:hypothetical protein
LLKWLLDPSHGPTVALISLSVGVVGIVLTLGGLYFTFRQAKKAADAVRDFRLRVSRQDASRDMSEAAYALDTTRRHLNNGAWKDAVDSYEDARRAFIRIDVAAITMPEEHREAIRRSADQMGRFCNKVDTALSNKGSYPDTAKAKAVIRKNYELLAVIQRVLEESVSQ